MEREQAAFDSLWQREIDGAILCSSRLPADELESSIARFGAVVLVNRELPAPSPSVATINVNDQLGAQVAVQHFLARGRTRVALIAGPATSVSGQRRVDGYRAALKAANMVFDPELLEHCAPTTEGGRRATHAVLARRPKVDAIFAFNDLVAFGVLQACEEAARAVPEEIAVIGVDDVPLAQVIRPHLTTLRVDLPQIGRIAMETLLATINEEDHVMPSYQIDPTLVLRDSA